MAIECARKGWNLILVALKVGKLPYLCEELGCRITPFRTGAKLTLEWPADGKK